ncbi:PepSY domain-containing protein [Salipiger bermudensis]|uniref:PepSY domain-containing protein n=1 Tax=Salipiger bermudensis TaxID=344736 RepID=UPI001C998C84|nr:PepSY domain-containing protein [Salipiger bermudensis]MBY6005157.1 PepSY domain-containing protein [Salipiger bermudensis]
MTTTFGKLGALALGLCLAAPALADDHAVPEEAKEQIAAKLADLRCEVDPDDIEMTDEGGYDLDDVICEGTGQFDIVLDAEFNEVSRRAE